MFTCSIPRDKALLYMVFLEGVIEGIPLGDSAVLEFNMGTNLVDR